MFSAKIVSLLTLYLDGEKPDNGVLSSMRLPSLSALIMLAAINTFVILPAQAQIFECGGTFTNQPCPGATPIMDEIAAPLRTKSAQQLEKRDLVHTMTTKRYQAKERFHVDLDSSAIERFCQVEESAVGACRERIDSFLARLENRVIEEQKLQLQRKELEINQQRMAEDHQNNNVIVVQGSRHPYRTPTFWPTYTLPGPGRPVTSPYASRPPAVPAPSRGEVPNDARVPLPR